MYKYLLLLLPFSVTAGPYIELGLGVPLFPDSGYIPDGYGIASVGYIHRLDNEAAIDVGFAHRSLTGSDTCHDNNCNGDNAIEAKLRLEF